MSALLNSGKILEHLEDVIALFNYADGVKTIGEFIKQVNDLSAKYIDPENDPTGDKVNTFKGDMFEIFGEIFFRAFKNDPAVGLREYETVTLDDDYGVDAIGTNANGDRVAVQFKFKSNPNESVDYPAIAKTYMAGRCRHNLDLDKHDSIWLVTTGNGVTGPCKEVSGKRLRVIYRDIIAGKIDNNMSFWKDVEEQIGCTLDEVSR
jgi:hypothetical protein